ncbi:MAG TPA: DUF2259 domain-containing protein [Calditrichia bacterium]|nr:DUF2259 domain-containing protein [Calditrichota bacterium]HQU70863.1 DUF2259 domain-containing protein [Calditrichia bacterium]HQV30440.1 DUF2259 domain-containing protein [Calditrichia bacterium]
MRRSFLLSLLWSLLWAASVTAGDISSLNIIGFSEDGAYLAYERYGMEDGSGEAYSEIYVVDVAANDFVTTPFRHKLFLEDGQMDLNGLRRHNYELASGILRQYHIVDGHQGNLLIYHPITDLTYQQDQTAMPAPENRRVRFAEYTDNPTFQPKIYGLALTHQPAGQTCPLYDLPAQMFTLKLESAGKEKVLQADKHLPGSRGCVMAYEIERVYQAGIYLVVFLRAYQPGFEGHSVRHLVVSGTLRFEMK